MSKHIGTTVCGIWGIALLFGCATPVAQGDACSAPLTPAIANSCVVAKDVLWRGAKPDAAGASALVTLGVRSVVNLELLHDDLDAFRSSRPAIDRPHRIDYFRVREWEPNVVVAPALLDTHIAEFIAIVRTQAKPIYVHCRSGQNRTGVMVAAYRILEEGASIDAAIAEMGKYQGIWFKQDSAYLRQLSGERRAKLEAMIAKQVTQVRRKARLECSASGCTEK